MNNSQMDVLLELFERFASNGTMSQGGFFRAMYLLPRGFFDLKDVPAPKPSSAMDMANGTSIAAKDEHG